MEPLKVFLNSHVNAPQVGFGTLLSALHKFMRLDPRFDLHHEPYDAQVELYVGQPYDCFERYWKPGNGKRLRRGIFTMFEAPKLPPRWPINLRENFDFVVVPSHWCLEVFRSEGVDIPIYVAQLGIDPDQWLPPKQKPAKPMPDGSGEYFSILWQGTLVGDRKGGDIVAKVFDELVEKHNFKNWRLFLKCNPSYSKYGGTTIMLSFGKNWNKKQILMPMRRYELLRMMDFMDIAVFPTRGEGFGLIPIEQAAAGLPVILSRSSGCLDFVECGAFLPVDCGKETFEFVQRILEMDAPREDQIAEHLLWAYENRQEAREFGRKASEIVRRDWTWHKTCDQLAGILALEIGLTKEMTNAQLAPAL